MNLRRGNRNNKGKRLRNKRNTKEYRKFFKQCKWKEINNERRKNKREKVKAQKHLTVDESTEQREREIERQPPHEG